MDNIDKTEAIKIIEDLDNNKVDKSEIQVVNYMLEVKKNLAYYLNSLIKSAVSEDMLQELVKTKLIEQIPALNFDQLMKLYSTLNKDKSIVNGQLTDLLKPTQHANSPLLDVFSEIRQDDKDDFSKANESMTPEQLRQIDELNRNFRLITEKLNLKEKEKENEKSKVE